MIDDEMIKNLPETTGVYIMHDGADEIIYVGKAVNIRSRIRQHAPDRLRLETLSPRSAAKNYRCNDCIKENFLFKVME